MIGSVSKGPRSNRCNRSHTPVSSLTKKYVEHNLNTMHPQKPVQNPSRLCGSKSCLFVPVRHHNLHKNTDSMPVPLHHHSTVSECRNNLKGLEKSEKGRKHICECPSSDEVPCTVGHHSQTSERFIHDENVCASEKELERVPSLVNKGKQECLTLTRLLAWCAGQKVKAAGEGSKGSKLPSRLT